MNSRQRPSVARLLAVLVFSIPAGCSRVQPAATVAAGPSAEPPPPASAPAPVTVLPRPVLESLDPGMGASIADVAERVTPSVVSVQATKVVTSRGLPPGFGFPFGPFPGFGEQERRAPGLGSGVVVAPGIVVTNHHVVADAETLQVTSRDGRDYEVELVGSDEKSDLAVLRLVVDAADLTPLPLGDSSRLRLGDVVLAIGNPFGVGQTVTMGIVSAKGRADLGINAYEDFIQTDAAINPGNSGGALVSMTGELVGINTAILSRSGGYQGIGFAIPTEMARPIVESLLATGGVSRGWLGIGIQEVDAELAAALELPSGPRGVLVTEVEDGAPAAKAGIRRGDVIRSVNGRDVDSVGRLRNLIASAGAGASVKLGVVRDRRALVLDAALGTLAEATKVDSPSVTPSPKAKPLDGLTVEPLSDLNRRRFRVPATVTKGVVVTAIDRDRGAEVAGLMPGDVVLEVDRKPIATIEQFAAAWSAGKSRKLLVVSRAGVVRFVVVGK